MIIFIRYEKDIRKTNLSVPKEHYKIYYPSIYGREDYIILDILKEDVVYSNIDKVEITSEFIYKEENNDVVKVRIPSCEDLLGDKLTAFAPNTTGIPYYKKDRDRDRGMEINKQLFDIGYLFDYVKDIGIVRETFIKVVEKEISYRNNKNISLEMVIEDIFNTSLLVLNTKDRRKEREILLNGRKKLSGYIWNRKEYSQEKFFINAAKAAYLVMLIKEGENNIEKYKTGFDEKIEGEYQYLNKIKKISEEAFFYLYKAVELWK